jgi:anti-sigma factor RsiW
MRLTAPPLVCREAVELMSDYLEGSLSRRDRRRLEKHLAGCDACSAYLEQMRAVIALSGTVVPEDLEPQAVDDLVEVFRRFREESGEDR